MFEVVGSAAVLEQAYALTGRGGGTVSVGLPHPDARISLPALSIVAEGRSILGSYMGSAQPQQDIPAMLALWRVGRLPVEKLKSGELPLDARCVRCCAHDQAGPAHQDRLPGAPSAPNPLGR
ncbi:Probable alcohol dehydrogenase, zinc-containing [Mycobacteroides abscessus subsp. massiliense]|nr:Probable alcohol dehydrogenase, zinc-containing [Mycobacteroides abscessus subsp. massiliense]